VPNDATTVTPAAKRSGAATRQREPHTDLLAWREEFPILARKNYLNNCSLGPLSRRSMAALDRFQALWNEHGAQAWYTIWMGELDALRGKVARLIGAQSHEIAIAPSVSVALGEISSGLDLGKRKKVVLADMDFPTLAYQWLAQERLGVQVQFVESADRITLPAERFRDAIDQRTGLVATSRVFYLSGYIQDVAALGKMAHEQGALMLVDDYQGTGQIPIDVKAANVDFLVTGTLKWLMGGQGMAFIYAREDRIPRLRPAHTGWWAARDQFQFNTREFAYRDDAQRLEAGTPPVPSVYIASAALDIVLEVGVERIRERTRWLADDLARKVVARGWKLRSPLDGAQRSSIILIELDQPDELVRALTERDIIVDHRPGLLRISPSFFNTVEESDQILGALDELLAARKKGRPTSNGARPRRKANRRG
jgi:kynureninase